MRRLPSGPQWYLWSSLIVPLSPRAHAGCDGGLGGLGEHAKGGPSRFATKKRLSDSETQPSGVAKGANGRANLPVFDVAASFPHPRGGDRAVRMRGLWSGAHPWREPPVGGP